MMRAENRTKDVPTEDEERPDYLRRCGHGGIIFARRGKSGGGGGAVLAQAVDGRGKVCGMPGRATQAP